MKKFASLILSALFVFTSCFAFGACSQNRGEILKIYNPGEYMDEDIFPEFEEWYKEQTGKTVKVKIDNFTAVEDIQRTVEQNKADYDLICPSDYMIEHLIETNLLLKVDKNIVNVEELIKPAYLETSREFDPTLEYSVPFMYGTLGIMYDYSKTGKHIDSWEALFGNEFNNKRSIKDSVRDAYAAACLYNAREELNALSGDALHAKVQDIFEDATDATIASAKNTIQSISGGAVWDVDNVKFEMAANASNVQVALMWSCDAGYVMNDYEDDDGNEKSGNKNLWYVIPKEGGNVYIDAFVISKYAKNVDAANYFLKYLCQKDVAIRNSEYIGAISPVAAAYDELYEQYTDPEFEMFEDVSDNWRNMYIETMFPSAETLNRCGVMKDFGDRKGAITRMWSSLR